MPLGLLLNVTVKGEGAYKIDSGNELIRSRKLFGIGSSSEYALADIKNLRVAPLPVIPNLTDSRGNPGLMLHIGLIAFDYGYKTCRIGHGLEELEARELVQRISMRFPSMAQKIDRSVLGNIWNNQLN